MKKILLIGIGPGNLKYLTLQAIDAINAADVFFLFQKPGRGKDELADFRRQVLEKYATRKRYRVVTAPDPERARAAPEYRAAVETWRKRREEILAGLIRDELADGETGALLIWGDPCLYDGSIEILQSLAGGGAAAFTYEIVPGITSVQALAERHKIALNRTGETIAVTTGRRLAETARGGAENIVVMLDQGSALAAFPDQTAELFWGAYLGAGDELLLSGKLGDVRDQYDRVKTEARDRKGWIMDTYLLRRSRQTE